MEIIDSYSETNCDGVANLKDFHPSNSIYASARGQSFTCTNSAKIMEAKFYLKKEGSPTGNAHAVLYAHSGTYGTSSLPTGPALATSDDFDVSTLTTSYQLITFTFTGAQQYTMEDSTYYCIVYENPASGNITLDFYVIACVDASTPTHDGNAIRFVNSSWLSSEYDTIFYVYGELLELGGLTLTLNPSPKGGTGRPPLMTGGGSFGG